jgi:hypothetical protein
MLTARQITRTVVPLLVLLFAVDILFSLFATCDQISHYPRQKYSAEKYCTAFSGPFIGDIWRIFVWVGHFLHDYDKEIVALFTAILTLSTIALWWSTRKLWRAGNEQFELARQEFIATHRPRIIVRFIQGPFQEDDRRFIFITFVNIGDSEATIQAIGADLAIWRIGGTDGGHWDPPGLEATPVDLDPVISLASGQRHTVRIISRGPWGDSQIWADTHDQIQTVARGAIEYRDGNGVLRETGFCRILDSFGTFHASKNPEEEYQD